MPASKPPRTAPRPYHHGNLPRALLDEALATIRASGVDGLTLREIGARLGVSRTALYRHFADKRALLGAVAIEGFRALRLSLIAAWEQGGGGPAGLRSMGYAYVRFAMASPAHYRVMFGSFEGHDDRDAELVSEAERAFGALAEALAAMQRNGIVRGDEIAALATFVWSVVHGVAMLAIDGRLGDEAAVERHMRYAVDRIWTGVEAPAGQS